MMFYLFFNAQFFHFSVDILDFLVMTSNKYENGNQSVITYSSTIIVVIPLVRLFFPEWIISKSGFFLVIGLK